MKKQLPALLILFLSACAIVSCNSRHVAGKPDTKKPTIISVSPASGETAVAITTAITTTFSEGMNASTINDRSLLLVSVSSTTSTPVSGNVTVDPSSMVAIFTTTAALEHNTQYTVTITTGVTDAAGNAIESSYSWSFITIPSPGSLDESFGTGGKVGAVLVSSDDKAFAAAIQQDGKIVTAGYSTLITLETTTIWNENYYFTIARFQPTDGALDTTFGFKKNGWSDDIVGRARSVELLPDGKIVAAGDSSTRSIVSAVTITPSNSDFLIARYNADGTLDTSFGVQSNGTVTIDMGYDYHAARSLAIQSDGKIVVAGDGINSGSTATVSIIARLTNEGALDTSFNGVGWIKIPIGTTSSQAMVVKMQSDGKIVIGGNYRDVSGPASFYLARYDSNGAPDASFNSGILTASPGTDSVLADIAILPNGKILVAGTTIGSINTDVFLMRYYADGTLDTTFGSAGTVITDDIVHGREAGAGLAVQTDGKIVVAATFRPAIGAIVTTDFALLRYESEGALDITFGNGDGMVTTDLGGANEDIAYDVQVQQDGKIVVVGTGSSDCGLARYWP